MNYNSSNIHYFFIIYFRIYKNSIFFSMKKLDNNVINISDISIEKNENQNN